MEMYLKANTNINEAFIYAIDFIMVELNTGEVVSINWDESDFGIDHGIFTGRYKGIHFNEDYANGRLSELKGSRVLDVELYWEGEQPDPMHFSITELIFSDGEEECEIPPDKLAS